MELVVMLYDGAIRFVGEARAAIARKDVRARTEATRRALDIVSELQMTLNVKEGGDIARELDRLYSYMTEKLLAVTRGDAAAAEEVHKLLGTLREGFSQAAAPGTPAGR
jgi:flagellar secretion chaperone FliS